MIGNMDTEDYIEEIREMLIREGYYDPEDSNPSEDDPTEEEFNDLVEYYMQLAKAILEIARGEYSNGEYAWFTIGKIEHILSTTNLEPEQDEIRKICDYHVRWEHLEIDELVDVLEDTQIYRYSGPKPKTFLEKLSEVSDEDMMYYEEWMMKWNKKKEEQCRKCLKRENCVFQKML